MSSRVQRVWGAAVILTAMAALLVLAGCSKPADNTTPAPNNTTTNNTSTTTTAPDSSMTTTAATPAAATTTPAAEVKCAVCGQTVGTPMTVSYEGKDFTVCSQSCKDAFDKEPAKYAAAAQSGGSTN